MASRLDRITEWKRAARKAGYSVEALARRVGVTDRQLERFFWRRFACKPKKWMDVLRMADSQRDMRRGLMIKEVAQRRGFKHVQDFIRAFKRVTGFKSSASRNRKPPDLRP